MALNFPANPVDGELYPNPAVPGAQQYIYNSSKGTWLTVMKGVSQVRASEPLFTTGTESVPIINIRPATDSQSGYLSAEDKATIDKLGPDPGTVTSITAGAGLGAPATGDSVTTTGTIKVLPATSSSIGGVIVGDSFSSRLDGTISLKPASSTLLGGVKQGQNITIAADGTISSSSGSTLRVLDNLTSSFDGVRLSFQMTSGGVPVSPPASSILLFLGGIIQIPDVAFGTINSTLSFSEAPAVDTNFYGVFLA